MTKPNTTEIKKPKEDKPSKATIPTKKGGADKAADKKKGDKKGKGKK